MPDLHHSLAFPHSRAKFFYPMENHGNGKLPYVRFYPRDFCADPKVVPMTTRQVGAYILLLCAAWEERPVGTLPCDDKILAKIARLTLGAWLKEKDAVLSAFTFEEDGRWHQKRMKAEYEKVFSAHQARIKGGIKSATKRQVSSSSAQFSSSSAQAEVQLRASESSPQTSSSENTQTLTARELRPKTKPENRRPANCAEVKDFVIGTLGLTENDAFALWEHWLGNGFTNNKVPMKNWKATASTWFRRNFFFPSLNPNPRRK
jgi:uncharacterized protein YdaU (DUF1376 family)